MGGLQSNVFIESLLIEKQKLGYNDVGTGAAAEASVRCYIILCTLLCLLSLLQAFLFV